MKKLTIKSNVGSISHKTAASAQGKRVKEFDLAMPAARGYASTPGLAEIEKGLRRTKLDACSSEAEQSLSKNISKSSKTMQESPVAGPNEDSSTSPSSRQTSSEESTPPTSNHVSPPRTLIANRTSPPRPPIVHPPASVHSSPPRPPTTSHHGKSEKPSKHPTEHDQREQRIDNSKRLRELELESHGDVRVGSRWDKLPAATRTNPFLNDLIGEHMKRQQAKNEASRKEYERELEDHCRCPTIRGKVQVRCGILPCFVDIEIWRPADVCDSCGSIS